MGAKGMHKKWGQIVAKAWMDPKFKQELIAHPAKVLKEHGIELPGVQIKVMENTKHDLCLILPVKPEGLSDEDLKNISAAEALALAEATAFRVA